MLQGFFQLEYRNAVRAPRQPADTRFVERPKYNANHLVFGLALCPRTVKRPAPAALSTSALWLRYRSRTSVPSSALCAANGLRSGMAEAFRRIALLAPGARGKPRAALSGMVVRRVG